ncbi:hypothetical protein ACFX1Q_043588 [Malus domestica]
MTQEIAHRIRKEERSNQLMNEMRNKKTWANMWRVMIKNIWRVMTKNIWRVMMFKFCRID